MQKADGGSRECAWQTGVQQEVSTLTPTSIESGRLGTEGLGDSRDELHEFPAAKRVGVTSHSQSIWERATYLLRRKLNIF